MIGMQSMNRAQFGTNGAGCSLRGAVFDRASA
jgi:hypothetical protein